MDACSLYDPQILLPSELTFNRDEDLQLASEIAGYYGYKLVESKRLVDFHASVRHRDYFDRTMDAEEKERFTAYVKATLMRHAAGEAAASGFIQFSEHPVFDRSYPYDSMTEYRGTLTILKPKETNDETNASN